MKLNKRKIVHQFVIWTFVTLYFFVSLISMIHVVDFFKMSNNETMSIMLAIAFEIGAAASLASIVVLEKMNKTIIWFLFILLTFFQAMGNTFYAYVHLKDFIGWVELFGLNEFDVIYQKRILSLISGAILPIVALGFIKALVDYIRPDVDKIEHGNEDYIESPRDIPVNLIKPVIEQQEVSLEHIDNTEIENNTGKEQSEFEEELNKLKEEIRERKQKEAEQEFIEKITTLPSVEEIKTKTRKVLIEDKKSKKPL